jgi:stage III sporulation protein AE
VSEGIEREYRDLLDSLPEGVAERLPEEMHPDGEATDFERVAEGVAEMSGFAYLLGEVGNVLSVEWGTAWRTLARTVGLLLISAVAEVLRRTFRSEALSRALSWGVSFALFAAVLSTLYAQLQKTARFLEQVTALVTGLLPLMAALHAMGGNVAVAAVQHSTLLLFLSICENVCGRTVMPMTGMCLSLTVSTVFSSGPSLRGLTALIKSSYTRTLGFVMLLLSFVLSTQTLLRAAADSLTARAAKFLAGNLIPVVGGALGDTFRTVASGVAFLKSTVGVGVMIVLFLMLLPVLISLLLTRLSFRLSLTVSDLLGCETESRLLNELVGIYGTLIAVVSMCTVFLIFALTLFVRVSAA